MVILINSKVKEKILAEAYVAPYLEHPGSMKMYRDLKNASSGKE